MGNNRAMKGTFTQDGTTSDITAESEAKLVQSLAERRYFWLDLDDADPHDNDAIDLLRNTFGFHPLAVEDAEHFGQRPKIVEYDDYAYMVVHGAESHANGTIEVHIFFNDKYTVNVRRGDCPLLDDVRGRMGRHPASELTAPQVLLVYLIVDALTDSFFPVLTAFDERVDTLEDAILSRPTEEQLGILFQMKRRLVAIRKVITPQRDMFASLSSGVTQIPGMNDESARYFRDLYDHLIRISDMVDAYRDLLSGVMDTHISTVSNRLNVVMKQLAIIATIFLPLSWLTGFFGQNFGWMVMRLTNFSIFLGAGIGLEVVAVIILLMLFRRRGWLGGPSA